MKQNNKLILVVFVLIILFGSLPARSGLLDAVQAGSKVAKAAEEVQTSYSIKLPLVVGGYPYRGFFGVEMTSLSNSTLVDGIRNAGSSWVRLNGLLWSEVEPTPGQRNWNTALGRDISTASQNHLEVILVVRSTPIWARLHSGSSCGPIRESEFNAFAQFLKDAVALYGSHPYNVKYWEIWNEPDVAVNNSDFPFGCWGEHDEPAFGGNYFGKMLKVVYPAIKSADPEAKVLLGGLLLDCNPNKPGACTNSLPPTFLTGIMNAGAGDSFDGISFHGYDYYAGGLGQYGNSGWNSSWNTTGPVLIEKVNFVRSILNFYGYQDKFLINTETALLVPSGTCDSICQETKAYYVAQSYAAGMALDLKANIWYSATGWMESGLFGPQVQPLPAYQAFTFARSKLDGANPVRKIENYPGLVGYEFKRGNNTIWLIWSKDGADHVITPPGTPAAVWDALGAAQTYAGGNLTVTIKPLYIEW